MEMTILDFLFSSVNFLLVPLLFFVPLVTFLFANRITNNEVNENNKFTNIEVDENNEITNNEVDENNEITNDEYEKNNIIVNEENNEITNNEFDEYDESTNNEYKKAEEYDNKNDNIEDKIFPNYEKAVEEFFSEIDHGMKHDRWETYITNFLRTTESIRSEMIEYLTHHQQPQNQVLLGVFYLQESQRQQAFQEFKKAAESNNSYGQYFLGYCYSRGIGTSEDSTMAVYWQRQAVNQRNPAAYFALALCYDNGIGVKKDQKKSYVLYCKAMENGYLGSFAALAYAYDRGMGVQLDMHKTIYWLRKSKEAGNTFAHVYIEAKFSWKHRS
ncbi:4272_t:CDS:1 [Ambispora leptoticha]|uniref:4272_t:CDS:1 n=1 Tax=Ambispora leptoticha TaxID=144679 RepID=A0A9N9DJW4_9GLOM|nr:4272_t:CDS:1 [Ambispora leptoticha]